MTTTKMVIADDHQLFRKALVSMLHQAPGLSVIGEAGNGYELVSFLEDKQPDLVLMDLQMPIMDGFEATQYIKTNYPEIKIVVLSMHDDAHLILQLMEMGINGYLMKNAEPEEMETTIANVMTTGYYFNHHIANLIRLKLMGGNKSTAKPADKYTKREVEIIKLVCKEMTSSEIADYLNLSYRTVEGHRKRIMEKAGVKNAAGLVCYAIKNGLVSLV